MRSKSISVDDLFEWNREGLESAVEGIRYQVWIFYYMGTSRLDIR